MFNKLCLTLCACMLAHIALLNTASGQCLTAPPAPAACTGSESLATNGGTINTSTTKWFYAGTPTAYDNLTMNGGTLIVCGDLLVDKFFFHSGTVYILPGGRLGIGAGGGTDMEGNCAIYNYGTFDLYKSLGMKNMHASTLQPNIIINNNGATFSIHNNYLVIDNPYSWFVNNGNSDFHGLVLDPGCSQGCICMGNNSQFHIDHLVNKTFNTFNVPTGGACFSVTQISQFCEQLTNNPNVYTCINPGHNTDSSCLVAGGKHVPWGNAQVFNVCSSCATVTILPVHFTSFTVEPYKHAYRLNWKANGYPANALFNIERSADGTHFAAISTTPAVEPSPGNFYCYDEHPLPGSNFYRITCISPVNGLSKMSMVVMGKTMENTFLPVYPNPFSTNIYASVPGSAVVTGVTLTNFSGQLIATKIVSGKGNNTIEIAVVQKILPGLYTLHISTTKGVSVQKLFHQ